MNMLYMYLIGLLAILYTYKYEYILLRLDIKALSKWTLFISCIGVLKYFIFQIDLVADFVGLDVMSTISWKQCIYAGFEEAMFTLPMYYISKHTSNKIFKTTLMGMMASIFAYGHIYQSWFALIPTFTYMFFLAPVFVRRFGLLTMVLGHIIYDLSMWVIIYFIK